MYFAVLCLLLLVSSTQAGPLPKLRIRPPKWLRLQPIKIVQPQEQDASRKFDSIVHFELPRDNEIRSLFGENGAIYLTKGKNKRHNNMLNIVEQLVEDEMQNKVYQGDRDVMEVVMGLKRGLRRQGGLPPKLEYEFNELVA